MRPSSDTLLVWTGAPCGYGCSACPIDAHTARAGLQPAELERDLAALPATAGRLVVLLGGEPFLRPDLWRLIAIIRAAGGAPGIITSGRALLYPRLRERLRRAGLAYLRFQLFGGGEAHDRATQVPGAFEQALSALGAWTAEAGTQCDVDVALSTRSLPMESVVSEVETLARAIASPAVQIVIAIDPARRAQLQETDAVRRAAAALADWNADPTRPLLAWEGLAEAASPASCLTIPPLPPHFVGGAPHACCLGAVDDLAAAESASRQPARANSFNFVRTATSVPWTAESDACTAYRASEGVDPHRHVWLVGGDGVSGLRDLRPGPSVAISASSPGASPLAFECRPIRGSGSDLPVVLAEEPREGRHSLARGEAPGGVGLQSITAAPNVLRLYVTDTGDFAPAEIARVKDELSHVFIDCAPAGVLDDFTAGMRRVLPDPTCDACVHRARCGRRFHVVDGAPFAREEAWIARYIAGLHGRVLDVGCGEQLYRNVLGPLIRAHTVDYTGLDPDALSLASLRAEFPAGRFHLGGIEDFRGAPASYDRILCLRSLNHVDDLDEALARMAQLLQPGGQLLLVECTPFAMLREHEQVAAADRAPRAGHQHFRNLASEDVLPVARRRSLTVLEHSPATRETTNEWILLLGRVAG